MYRRGAVLVAVFLLTGAGPPENAASGALSALAFIVIKDLLVQQLPNAPRRYVLCPVVDLCNHSGNAVSDLAYGARPPPYFIYACSPALPLILLVLTRATMPTTCTEYFQDS